MFYDKKVKYLDYLENGDKIRSAGFVKIEVADDVCNIQININGLYPTDTFVKEVWISDGKRETVLGEVSFEAGRGLAQWKRLSADRLGRERLPYNELEGLRISLGKNRELRCRWSDHVQQKAVVESQNTTDGREHEARNGDENRNTGSVKAWQTGPVKNAEIRNEAVFAERTGSNVERTESIAERTGINAERTGSNAERTESIAERTGSNAERTESIAERTRSTVETGFEPECERGRETTSAADHENGCAAESAVRRFNSNEDNSGKRIATGTLSDMEREPGEASGWHIVEPGFYETVDRARDAGATAEDLSREGIIRIWEESVHNTADIDREQPLHPAVRESGQSRSISQISEPEQNRSTSQIPEPEQNRSTSRIPEPEQNRSTSQIPEPEQNRSISRIPEPENSQSISHPPKPIQNRNAARNLEEAQYQGQGQNQEKGQEWKAAVVQEGVKCSGNEDSRTTGETNSALFVKWMEDEGKSDGQSFVPPRLPEEPVKQKNPAIPERLFDDKWKQLSSIYPHISPFHDERDYLSIGPGDFVILQRGYHKLVNNSFLLHGYYNYEHLILTRVANRNEERYYVGVPGNFYEREKQVAVMFGFESFECKKEPAQTGDFGYYMIRVEI